MNVLFIKENRTLNVRFRIQLLDFARTSILSWSCHQDGRSEDKVQLRRCFVQSNYSGSWTEPVCVLHRICGHETEDDKKKIRDSARLFNSSVIISEWNTHKKSSFPFNACGNRSFLDDDCCNISLTELST